MLDEVSPRVAGECRVDAIDVSDVRRLKRSRVLNALRREPGISKIGLARSLRISATTVGLMVDELVAEGLVVASGLWPSTGGRRAERLFLNADGPLAIGVDLGETDARFGALDLTGRVVATLSRPFRRAEGGAVDPTTVSEGTRELLAGLDRPVAGVGLAIPGLVDRDSWHVRHATNLGWADLPLESTRRDLPGIRRIDRNTHALLLAEEWWGSAADADPTVFVTVGSGIGAAIRVNGTFLTGVSGAAGEFGHIPIVTDGPDCRCGRRGCLEALASSSAVQARYRRLIGESADWGSHAALAHVITRADAGDSTARFVLDEAARHLATGLTTLVNLVNPALIVLGGELMDAEPLILPAIQAHVRARALPEASGAVRIVSSSLGADAALTGAATLVFEALFSGESDSRSEAAA